MKVDSSVQLNFDIEKALHEVSERNRKELRKMKLAVLEPIVMLVIAGITMVSALIMFSPYLSEDSQKFSLDIAQSIENSIVAHPESSIPITVGPILYEDYKEIYQSKINNLPNSDSLFNGRVDVTSIEKSSFILCYSQKNTDKGHRYDSRTNAIVEVKSCK